MSADLKKVQPRFLKAGSRIHLSRPRAEAFIPPGGVSPPSQAVVNAQIPQNRRQNRQNRARWSKGRPGPDRPGNADKTAKKPSAGEKRGTAETRGLFRVAATQQDDCSSEMALTFELKASGYCVAKFAGSRSNVFIFRYDRGVGFVGVRKSVAVRPDQQAAATANRDAVAQRIGRASDLFEPFSWAHPQPPSWAKRFTPGKPPEDFFQSYTWFRYRQAGAVHDFLRNLTPNP